jgi:UDPglucose 6-dehydrogenase
MKLVIVGTGYVGLVSGLCFSEFGFQTVCVDKDTTRIDNIKKGHCPFYEPGLESLLNKHLNDTKLLSLNVSLSEAMINADIVFITVGTPTKRLEDDADLTAVYKVAEEIANNIKNYCLIVTKSTVPVGTTREVNEIIAKKINKKNFDTVSNPEFLREGSAIDDFMKPDRIVIGCDNLKAEKMMRELYRPLFLLETPIVSTTIESAEIIKYAANSFLATKIAFINQVADLCEVVGGNVQDVAKAMGLDKRIGSKFLHAGPGFGGSCFPKDVKAFSSTAKKLNVNLSIIDSVNNSNQKRPKEIVLKISKYFNNSVKGKVFSILGLTFKPNTDDVRDSTSIIIAQLLSEKGAIINAYDPRGMENAKISLPNINYTSSIEESCIDANAIIIATEWNEFRALNFKFLKEKMKDYFIFDLRNIYNKKEIANLGFIYRGIGK